MVLAGALDLILFISVAALDHPPLGAREDESVSSNEYTSLTLIS